jgi:hypothetical protein
MALKMVMMEVPTRLYVMRKNLRTLDPTTTLACYEGATKKSLRVSRKYLCSGLRIYLVKFLKDIYITLQLIQFKYN